MNHIYYYESSKPKTNPNYAKDDYTIELLMYALGEEATRIFLQPTAETIHAFFAQGRLFSLFEIDEFIFEPFGYSVNGVREDLYFTIHVTPQKECSYASFETNLETYHARSLIQELITMFAPQSFDIVIFHPSQSKPQFVLEAPIKESSIQELGDKYFVHFYHYGDSK